jgi:hypothetical protein
MAGSLALAKLPESLEAIGDGAFAGCSGLESIVTGDSLTQIGLLCFANCVSLSSIALTESLRLIGARAFSYCSALSFVFFPDSLVTIGCQAFLGSGLRELSIFGNISGIDPEAFAGCFELSVHIRGLPQPPLCAALSSENVSVATISLSSMAQGDVCGRSRWSFEEGPTARRSVKPSRSRIATRTEPITARPSVSPFATRTLAATHSQDRNPPRSVRATRTESEVRSVSVTASPVGTAAATPRQTARPTATEGRQDESGEAFGTLGIVSVAVVLVAAIIVVVVVVCCLRTRRGAENEGIDDALVSSAEAQP